jgi:hypothetical protein
MFDAKPTGLFGRDVLAARAELKYVIGKWGRNVEYFSRRADTAIQSFNRGMEDVMAASKNLKSKLGKGKSTEKEFEWKGFINVSLSADQKEQYSAWDIQDQDVWDGLASYAQSGYKINLSFNRQNDKFNVTFTGQPECGENSGYAVSAFAKTPYSAARVALFKVSSVLPEVWTEYDSGDADDIG